MPSPVATPEAAALSVGELTARIKDLLETGFAALWVRGEISNLRVQASGHSYFTLKDERAQLSAVLFRGDAARSKTALRDGQQVVAFGQLSVYEARGQYQLIVRVVVEDGVGRLQAEFERLKQRLAAEGLFAPENKVPVPALPRTIGFITSPTGAAVQDFLRILMRRRWRGRVVILPAKVQGAGAAAEMIAMLELAQAASGGECEAGRKSTVGGPPASAPGEVSGENPVAGNSRRTKSGSAARVVPTSEVLGELPLGLGGESFAAVPATRSPGSALRPAASNPGLPAFDLLVIGRGGGSLEDLWAFNEEPLVRAVAACRIPILSAVGHEIDFTLCDFAADVRAETPSAAAELISSGFLQQTERVVRASHRFEELAADLRWRLGERVDAARKNLRLLAPSAQVEQAWLRLDDLTNRLAAALRHSTAAKREQLTALRNRLERASPELRIRFDSQRLLSLFKRLQAASPDSVLHRGFAIVRDEQGRPVARRAEIAAGQKLQVQYHDGTAPVRAE